MSNKEKYVRAFAEALDVDTSAIENLEYQSIPQWDSIEIGRAHV